MSALLARAPAADGEPLVRIRGVTKSYDGVSLAVRELDLDVARGEFLTFLGPSGSGKTTTLMMLAGFETPTSGEIALEGRSLIRVPAHRRNIGVVFQSYALFPHMTVAENVGFPLRMRNVPAANGAERVRRALDMVQLGSFGDRHPNQLSGGQQQRVAVARALVFEPSLVLMDEPLGALDKQLREQMQGELRQLHRRLGVTIVYVTHDQSEALTMSDRIAVFNDGRIEQLADPAELYERPANAFVAYFIGESNRLMGRVTGRAGEMVTVTLASGRTIRCLGAGVADGQPVCLSVRPERILVGGAAGEAENSIGGHLRDGVYHGDHLRLGVTLEGDGDMILKIANAPRRTAPAVGEPITLGWNAADCRAFPAAQSAA